MGISNSLSLSIGSSVSMAAAGTPAVPAVLPVMSGLEAYWDWTGGSPLASKVGSHTLTQGSGATVTVVDVTGGPGDKAASFDGSTDFLVIPGASVGSLNLGGNAHDACTVFAWVERDETDTGFIAGCWQEDDGDPRRQYGLFIDLPTYGGTEQVCGHVSKTGEPTPGYPFSRDYSANTRTIDNTKWQFAAFTYDGANARSYLAAIFDARPSFTDSEAQTYSKNPYAFADGLNTVACDFTMGAVKLTAGMNNFYAGRIGPVAVYNRALSQAEITTLYRSFLSVSDPVYEWDFNRLLASQVSPRALGWNSATASTVLTDVSTPGPDFGGVIVGSVHYLARGTTGETGPMVGWSGDIDGVSLDDISEVRWLLNSGVTDSLLRLVIRSGGAWYATDETFDLSVAGVSGSDWTNAVEQIFTFGREAALWRDLTFVPGSSLSLAGAARSTDLPAGNITAVGFYSPTRPSAAIRIDNVKVNA